MTPKEQEKLDKKLRKAASKGKIEDIKKLLAAGADINKDGLWRHAPLVEAAYCGKLEAVKFLLEAGVDHKHLPRAENYARKRGHKEVETFLKEYQNPTPAVAGNPDEVTFERVIGNRLFQEFFDFRALERITLVRKDAESAVETTLRDSFSTVADKATLRKAFEEHLRRGGKVNENAVFPGGLFKSGPKI